MRRLSLFALTVCLLAPLSNAQTLWWKGSFEGAQQEAMTRNVPLLVCFNQDGEEASERAVGFYRTAEWQKLCGQVVAVICSPEQHDEREIGRTTGGGSERVCSRFEHASCGQHRAVERAARVECWGAMDAQVLCPSHFVLVPSKGRKPARGAKVKPSGWIEVWQDATDVPGLGDVDRAIREAQRMMGRGLSTKQVEAIRKTLSEAESLLASRRVSELAARLEEVGKIAAGTPFEKRLAGVKTRLEGWVKEETSAIERLADEGQILAGLRRCMMLGSALEKTPWEKSLKTLERSIAKRPGGRDAAKILKNERKALPLMKRAQSYDDKGEFGRAAKSYAQVIARAPGSVLAEEAMGRLESLAADRDIGPRVAPMLREVKATSALAEARKLLRSDKDAGMKALQRLVEDYSGTKAAKSAQRILKR